MDVVLLYDKTGKPLLVGQQNSAGSLSVVVASDQSAIPVSAASLPLPTGAASEAGHLSAIDAKLPALGAHNTAGSVSVTVATDDVVPVSGTVAVSNLPGTQPVSGTITANAGTNLNTSALALEAGHLATIDTKTPALGQAAAGASVPVVLPSAQITTLTPPAAITGFALEAGHLATIDTSTARLPAQGQALAAASLPVVLTALQASALTPPTNTGYALDASLTTIDTDLKSNITLHAGTNLIGKVGIDQTSDGTTNKVRAAATAKALYAGAVTITPTTAIQTLANNGYWSCAAIDNSSNLYLDAQVVIKVKNGGSVGATASANVWNVYAYGSVDGTNYTDGLAGTDATVTPTTTPNLAFLGVINTPAASTSYTSKIVTVAAALGGMTLPTKWGIILQNASGGSGDGTAANFSLVWSGIQSSAV